MEDLDTEKGFALIGLVAALVFISVAAGIIYTAVKITGDKQPTEEESVIKPLEEEDDRPTTDFQPYKEPSNISGEWLGSYIVTEPEACAGIKAGWSATLTQSGTALSGSYKSDAISGILSGGAIIGDSVSWKVGGGEGDITFNGAIASPNTIDGSFIGPVCDKELAPSRTRGSFFGGRL